jgi:hypothetical protein
VEELVAPIEPRKRIVPVVVCREQKLVSMSGGRRDGITTLSFFLVAVGQDFLTQFNDLFPEGHWFAGRGGHGDETRGGLGVM